VNVPRVQHLKGRKVSVSLVQSDLWGGGGVERAPGKEAHGGGVKRDICGIRLSYKIPPIFMYNCMSYLTTRDLKLVNTGKKGN